MTQPFVFYDSFTCGTNLVLRHGKKNRGDLKLARALRAAGGSDKALDDNDCSPSDWGRSVPIHISTYLCTCV